MQRCRVMGCPIHVDAHSRRDRQSNLEACSASRPIAVCPYLALMPLHDVMRNGQPEPETTMVASGSAVTLTEAIEDEGEEIGVDTEAAIDDVDAQRVIITTTSDLNSSARWREFDCVRHDVAQNLLQTLGVSFDRRQITRDLSD